MELFFPSYRPSTQALYPNDRIHLAGMSAQEAIRGSFENTATSQAWATVICGGRHTNYSIAPGNTCPFYISALGQSITVINSGRVRLQLTHRVVKYSPQALEQ